jgi:hypothetical protein
VSERTLFAYFASTASIAAVSLSLPRSLAAMKNESSMIATMNMLFRARELVDDALLTGRAIGVCCGYGIASAIV